MHEKVSKIVDDILGPKHYFALLASLLSLTIVAPLIDHDAWTRIVVAVFLVFSLLTASLAVTQSRRMTFVSLFLVSLSGVMWIMSSVCNFPTSFALYFQLATFSVALLFFIATGTVMWKDIFSGSATGNRICGAVCIYILIGFCFAMIHLMVALSNPIAYKDMFAEKSTISDNLFSTRRHYPFFVYFSFCTLTTLGFGDIIPVSRLARSISWVEAATGQLYLAILVARLVGLHIVTTRSKLDDKFRPKSLSKNPVKE